MIHYHGGDIGGKRETAHRFFANRHIMISFAAPTLLPVVAESCSTFALDNGAFSAWKSGKTLDIEGYYKWVDEWRYHPSFAWAVIPDVIDGTERDNAKLIDQWPFRREIGVPVYHLHERPRKLATLVNWWPLVAIGSSGKWPTPGLDLWWDRIAEIMPFITNNGRVISKLHGLRMLDPEIFTRLPLHSADSCNAVINAKSVKRFGMYTPHSTAARANVIADRIESFQSADCWKPRQKTGSMFDLVELEVV